MWRTPPMRGSEAKQGSCVIHLVSCNFGGRKEKRRRLLTSERAFRCLAGPCRGHRARFTDADGREWLHAPWGPDLDGRFATAEEAEYPQDPCERMLMCAFGLQDDGTSNVWPAAEHTERGRKRPRVDVPGQDGVRGQQTVGCLQLSSVQMQDC